jgi:hypothetical protein
MLVSHNEILCVRRSWTGHWRLLHRQFTSFQEGAHDYTSSSYKDWACWSVPRQLTCHVNLFSALE